MAKSIIFFAGFLPVAVAAMGTVPATIELSVQAGPGPEEVTLSWSGGQVPFSIYRSDDPTVIVAPISKIGETSLTTWNELPPAASITYYTITSQGLGNCVPMADGDFDGYCVDTDCMDHDGSVNPGVQLDTCNGIDDDCDGSIDEDVDGDGDGFSICSFDPLFFDCDDGNAQVNPASTASLSCMGSESRCGYCDGVDNDCDGYVDEGCGCPDPSGDVDGDGSPCELDCDDGAASMAPGQTEACDGVDNDCNVFTVENCSPGNRCNWPSNADSCAQGLSCTCVLDSGGVCNGNYVCTGFCEGSFTGPLGAGCASEEACAVSLIDAANEHVCAVMTAPLGSKLGGEACAADSECRSGRCERPCIGPGCNYVCSDVCDHHEPGANGSCGIGATCIIQQAQRAVCGPTRGGQATTGDSCAADPSLCLWGPDSCVNGICSEPCRLNEHCPPGYYCSLEGNQNGNSTVPVCLAYPPAGTFQRPGGAACAANGDCASNFCEFTRGICLDMCTDDASCPGTLACEHVYVQISAAGAVTSTRMCLSNVDLANSPSNPYSRLP